MASPTGSERRRWIAAAAIVAACVASPSVAHAEGSALAQSLFDRARVLMDEGKFAEACPLLVESQRLDPGGGTLLNIAVCWENAGKLATANAAFHEALGQAIKDQRSERKKIAEERIAALGPRLSTLTVDVPPVMRIPGLQVFVDGTELSTVAWGVPAAVDGGDHRIDASAPDRRTWSTTLRVASEREQARVTVPELPSPDPAPLSPVAPGPQRDQRFCPPGMRVAGDTCERIAAPPTRFSTATWVTGGVGLGLVGFGAIAGAIALAKDGDAQTAPEEDGCNIERDFCPSDSDLNDARAFASDAETWGWISTGAIATGAVTTLVALLLPRELDTEATRPVAFIAPGGGFVGVRMTTP
jgi:hypothetical protein